MRDGIAEVGLPEIAPGRPLGARPGRPCIGYFVNVYPSISHTFIRREIRAMEDQGWKIKRYAIRRSSELVDAQDRDEAELTDTLLPLKLGETVLALLSAFARPARALQALIACATMAWRSDRGFFRSMFVFAEAALLLRRFIKDGVVHCHAHFGTNSASVVRIVRLLGGPSYSFTNHGPFEIDNPHALSLADKVKDASFVVAISSFGKAQLLRITPPDQWSRIHVVRCGLEFQGCSLNGCPVPETKQLISIGRFSAEKGHLILLQAAARLVHEAIAFRMVLVGDGPLRQRIESAIVELGICETVELTGSADEGAVAELLKASRACVVSSFAEGLPVVIMEAFRANRPVIATNVGAIAELVEDRVSGWLVPPADPGRLAAAMREALELPTERLAEMAAAGFQNVRRLHDIRRETMTLGSLFESVIAQRDRPRSMETVA